MVLKTKSISVLNAIMMMTSRDESRLNYLWAAKYVYNFKLDQEELDELSELQEKYYGRSQGTSV